MAWKFESGISLSEQITERIRQDIISGLYPPASAFPTVRQLAFEASVNPNTIQKSLTALEEEGLLITLSTQGRMVTDDVELIKNACRLQKAKDAQKIIKAAREMSLSLDELLDLIKKGWNENE